MDKGFSSLNTREEKDTSYISCYELERLLIKLGL